ncbi:MAG TPA: carboxypeptidase regulatory-like domain-containing protein [Candidatus Sulfotelmatobacter sp.]
MLSLHSPRLRFSLLALVTILALLFSSVALAQTTVATGSIAGTVADATGAVVPNAKVTITGAATGQIIHATSNTSGGYSAGNLVPGVYSVRVEAKGFKTTQLTLDVKVDTAANGSVKLEIGQESTVIEVQGSEIQVNTEQATVQGVLTSNQIENLPVNGRNFLDLAQLEPGVQIQDGENFDPTKVGYSSISFGGRFGRTARINVDGVDVSDETVGTTTEDIPASGIQEFSLAQSTLDLSNDLTSSGAVNVTTKSGTNAFHGEGFGFYRDSRVGAAKLLQPFDTATGTFIKTPYQRNQEGGSLGGPLVKDKLFFFLDGERTLQHLAAPIAETVPYDAFSGTFPAPFKEDELQARVDYSLTKNVRLFGRFNYFKNSVDATFFPSSFQVYNNLDYTRNDVAGVDFNTGGFTHSIRFSYLKFQNRILDAVRGSSLPFANYPVAINIGTFTVGPNLLAPQATPQSDHQFKYDGSKVIGKHILRFGFGWNHIQGGGFASFFKIAPQVFEFGPGPNSDPTSASVGNGEVIVGNGQGFSTTSPALGYPAGGLGPDNRTAFYIGDTWKLFPNLTISPGLRWERDTGRTDSDLPAIPELNAAFPGFGNQVQQPNKNFAPQLGIAWDPKSNGKTVIRAGAGLYYENVIYNNVLFDRPLRLRTGAFLQTPTVCFGTKGKLPTPTLTAGNITVDGIEGIDPTSPTGSYCNDTIANSAAALAAFQNTYQADNPFSLTAKNPAFIGSQLASGLNPAIGLFAPNYRSPRALQMNVGIQHEIRHGMVLSVDFLRNIETHALLGIDVNQAGSARHFNAAGATAAIAATEAACGHSGNLQATINDCSALNGAGAGATISNFTNNGLGTPNDFGSACPPPGCAFGGINPAFGQMLFLEPISRSVYNGLQMKLVENVTNLTRGVKTANFQVSYSLSRFVNPLAFAGNTPPSNPVSANDQDFVLQAADNDNPLKFMGPSLLDRTNQISFGGSFQIPYEFRIGLIGHFYSPLSSPTIVGSNGSGGQIFQTDFSGSGFDSQPMPGTKNGSYMRDFGLGGLNAAIGRYNASVAGQPTPAGQALVSNGLFTAGQLAQIGAVAPTLPTAPSDQLTFPWVRAFDFKFSWSHTFKERYKIEPSVGIFNLFNFANFNLPPGAMNGWLDAGSSINHIHTQTQVGETGPESDVFRVGNGTGVFGLGSPRAIEWGLRFTF